MRRLARRRQRGITLAELVVTATMLAFLAPGLILAVGTSERISKTAQKRAIARALTLRQIELFRQMCRTDAVETGTVYSSYTSLTQGTFQIARQIERDGNVATVEAGAWWSDTRGNGVSTDWIQLGTAMKVGAN